LPLDLLNLQKLPLRVLKPDLMLVLIDMAVKKLLLQQQLVLLLVQMVLLDLKALNVVWLLDHAALVFVEQAFVLISTP
jgi:hypothetical protein